MYCVVGVDLETANMALWVACKHLQGYEGVCFVLGQRPSQTSLRFAVTFGDANNYSLCTCGAVCV